MDRMPKVLRAFAFAMYVMYSLAGCIFIFIPSNVVSENTDWFKLLIWHVFLVLGGAFSMFGSLVRKPLIEAIGIPMLISSMTAYATILIVTSFEDIAANGPRLGVGFMFASTALGLLGRLVETLWFVWVDTKSREAESNG